MTINLDMAIDPYTGKPVRGAPSSTKHIAFPLSRSTDEDIRCTNPYLHKPTNTWRECGRLLAEMASRPWKITCSKCKTPNVSPPLPGAEDAAPPPG